MKQKKYKYKHLTDEMKKLIDEEIKKIGRSELYEKIKHNIEVQHISHLQNENGAFREIRKGPWVTTQWEIIEYASPNSRIIIRHGFGATNRPSCNWHVHVDNNSFDSIGTLDFAYVDEFETFLKLCGTDYGEK